MNNLNIAIYGSFPPPICGPALSNRILSEFLGGKGYKIKKYNTATEFAKITKFNLNKIIKGFKLLVSFLRDSNDIDIVYSAIAQSKFGFLKFFLMFKICQIKNIPYIIHLHGNMLPITFKTNKRLFQKMILDVLNKSNKVIVLSETLKKQVFFDVSKVEIINNFVEDDFFISYDNKKAILEDSTFKLFYLSNLIESKGILDVLRACLLLKDRGIKFHLTIAGLWQKEIKRKGQKIVKELGEEYVTYLGVVQGERKKEVIHKDHIFLLPTYYPQEGVPISILEAMAGGNVILTTRQGGIADIITEGKNGYFVEKKNPKGITDKICFLYQNFPKIKQISQNNIEYAKEFTVKQFVNSIETLIKSAVVENKHEQ